MFIILILTIITITNSIFCPEPLNSQPWNGGECYLIRRATLSNNTEEDVYLDMNATTINCNGGMGLDITNHNVVIINGKFINCSKSGRYSKGGCIYFSSYNNLTLINMSFDYCSSLTNGGGSIYTEGNQLTIINTTFNNSYSMTQGGTIFAYDNINIINSSFHNSKSNNDGGAIYFNGQLYINNSEFVNCSGRNGGAIYNYDLNDNNNNDISNSKFINCSSRYSGAVLFVNSLNSNNNIYSNSNNDNLEDIIHVVGVQWNNFVNINCDIFNFHMADVLIRIINSNVTISNTIINNSNMSYIIVIEDGNIDEINNNYCDICNINIITNGSEFYTNTTSNPIDNISCEIYNIDNISNEISNSSDISTSNIDNSDVSTNYIDNSQVITSLFTSIVPISVTYISVYNNNYVTDEETTEIDFINDSDNLSIF